MTEKQAHCVVPANRSEARPPLILHPFLFALYPVLSLLAENVQQMPIQQAYRSLGLVILGALVLVLLLRLVSGHWQRAALLSSVYLILFFSYGHVYGLLKTASFGGVLLGRHRYLVPVWIGITVLGTWIGFSRMRNYGTATRYLNVAAALSLLLPLYSLAAQSVRVRLAESTLLESRTSPSGQLRLPREAKPPDVYYIVVDSYGRQDYLQERYAYDNSDFVGFLRDRGFYVADHSSANYGVTVFSLASSLNLDYLQGLGIRLDPGSGIGVLSQTIKHSEVRRQLENLGYRTVATATGLIATEIDDADLFLVPERAMGRLGELTGSGALNPFESFLLDTSAAKILADADRLTFNRWLVERLEEPFYVEREIILSGFEHLEQAPFIAGPKIVFVHIISPHGPYLFGPNGEPVTNTGPFTLAETEAQDTGFEDVPRYLDQLTYVNKRLSQAIDAILLNSEPPPIIILQSDHGPGFGKRWAEPDGPEMRDRMAILNAYYLPAECARELYPTVTPVNTFRMVFNCYFESTYELHADVTYYSNFTGDQPFDFIPLEVGPK